jgi:arginase
MKGNQDMTEVSPGQPMRPEHERLAVIGVPSSAGAYAPGQESAPSALRAAGLLDDIRSRGVPLHDYGDTPLVRWCIDETSRTAMNTTAVAGSARAAAQLVKDALSAAGPILILGGDCTVELGTVAGIVAVGGSVRLLYIDLDTDLNTPESTTDGALDWMGVAHLLAIGDSLPELASIGSRMPLLRPDQLLYFAIENVEAFEREVIDRLGIQQIPLEQVRAGPSSAAASVVDGWAGRFDRLLIHLDVDVLDFARMPLAENARRNVGLDFGQLIDALRVLIAAPNWATLTVCELNPDHSDDATLRTFAEALAELIAHAPRWRQVGQDSQRPT